MTSEMAKTNLGIFSEFTFSVFISAFEAIKINTQNSENPRFTENPKRLLAGFLPMDSENPRFFSLFLSRIKNELKGSLYPFLG
jgi:hypothetical protein